MKIFEILKKPITEQRSDYQQAEKNLATVKKVAKFDHDIPLHDDGTDEGKKSQNQADKIMTSGSSSLYYIAIDPPHADVEAFVIIDGKGNCSYLDDRAHCIVLNNEVVDSSTSDFDEAVSQWVEDFTIGHGAGGAKPGAIEALRKLLELGPDKFNDEHKPTHQRSHF